MLFRGFPTDAPGLLLLITFVGFIAALTAAAIYRRSLKAARATWTSLTAGELADAAAEGFAVCEGGLIRDANASFLELLGLDGDRFRGQQLLSFVPPEHHDAFAALSDTRQEMELMRADNSRIAVEIAMREVHDGRGFRCVYAVQDIRERKAAEARIWFLAHHDPLTGLANRLTLQEQLAERLQRAWANDEQFAVFCLDLDRFKEVNDVFGHSAGDAVLVEVTRRLRGAAGPDDLIARLGGDEFTILSGHCDPAHAGAFAEQLSLLLSGGFAIGERKASVGVSIGIAVFPSHGTTAESLLNNADVALYRAKAEGGGSCCFYNSQMDLIVRERRALANDLAQALEAAHLELHFQPLAKVSSLAVRGFEALVRWRHPARGYVPPGEFVALAEENGLVHQLGLWVLRRACSEAAKWRHPLDIAVNISPLQFQQGDLPEQIMAILLETGLPSSRLELEITETVLITDFDRALSMLRRLKAMGLRIAMDDFGTGWSSLSSLQAFPFDKVKIDRTFIDKIGRHKQADVIVRAILGLCDSLEIPVLAEGVETQEQLEFLRQEGCAELQGYLLARPAPIEIFAQLVEGEGPQPCLINVA
jgi:diguanylate cyclase (GGDEF)-like protein/PAS domain S-box-containing protein